MGVRGASRAARITSPASKRDRRCVVVVPTLTPPCAAVAPRRSRKHESPHHRPSRPLACLRGACDCGPRRHHVVDKKHRPVPRLARHAHPSRVPPPDAGSPPRAAAGCGERRVPHRGESGIREGLRDGERQQPTDVDSASAHRRGLGRHRNDRELTKPGKARRYRRGGPVHCGGEERIEVPASAVLPRRHRAVRGAFELRDRPRDESSPAKNVKPTSALLRPEWRLPPRSRTRLAQPHVVEPAPRTRNRHHESRHVLGEVGKEHVQASGRMAGRAPWVPYGVHNPSGPRSCGFSPRRRAGSALS